jgi:hypothetical protein
MYMRPGITIQHSRERADEMDVVRSDIAGFIGVIRSDFWPDSASVGDFVELPLENFGDFEQSRFSKVFDPASARAVRSFFENGGVRCHLFGVYLKSLKDLMARDPLRGTFYALMERLRGQEDLGLLAVPILAHLPHHVDGDSVTFSGEPILEMLLHHCRMMNNRFLIIDAPKDLHDDQLVNWVERFQTLHEQTLSYGAVYYPWLMSGEESFAPSGAVAGVFARTEIEANPFGVRQPPANQRVRGVTHPYVDISWADVDRFLGAHVNLLMVQPAQGVVVWGARTMSRDPRWVHINSRRIISLVAEQLRRDNEWVIFENQRPQLWELVARSARTRLDALWSAGLLTGEQAGLDYVVQCDSETNPLAIRDAGELHVKVTLRPISTTEYIVVDLRLGT